MKPRLVAIVDHDAVVAMMLDEALSDEGYRTRVFAIDDDLLDQLRACRPDAIIMDIVTAGGTAEWRILEALRHDPALVHVPVLICTTDDVELQAHVMLWREQRCATLLKPFELDALFDTLACLLAPADRAVHRPAP